MRFTLHASLALAAAASADITPLSGTQSMSGHVSVWNTFQPPANSDSFSVSAPNAAASWSPPAQNITVSGFSTSAHVGSTMVSSISATRVRFSTSVNAGIGGGTGTNFSSMDFAQNCSLRFSVDVPTQFVLFGSITRYYPGGAPGTCPAHLTFGPEGQAAIMSLTHTAAVPLEYSVDYPAQVVTLQPGAYVVSADDACGASGGWSYSLNTAIRFDLAPLCYSNCDESTSAPLLTVNDFGCFINRFAAGDTWANCDHSTTAPVLNVLDFSCFLNEFARGCP